MLCFTAAPGHHDNERMWPPRFSRNPLKGRGWCCCHRALLKISTTRTSFPISQPNKVKFSIVVVRQEQLTVIYVCSCRTIKIKFRYGVWCMYVCAFVHCMQIERMAWWRSVCLYQPVAAATGTRSLQIRIKDENAIVIVCNRTASKQNNSQVGSIF